MVGGTVIGVARSTESALVNCEDKRRERLSVRCREVRRDNGKAVAVAPGDAIWWHGPWVMWTPADSARSKCGEDFDIQLPKIGYSH